MVKPPPKKTSGRTQEALQSVEPSDRDIWWRMAPRVELDESGFDIWPEWSQRSASFSVKANVCCIPTPAGHTYKKSRGLNTLLLRNDFPRGSLSVADLRYQQSGMTFPALGALVRSFSGEISGHGVAA